MKCEINDEVREVLELMDDVGNRFGTQVANKIKNFEDKDMLLVIVSLIDAMMNGMQMSLSVGPSFYLEALSALTSNTIANMGEDNINYYTAESIRLLQVYNKSRIHKMA